MQKLGWFEEDGAKFAATAKIDVFTPLHYSVHSLADVLGIWFVCTLPLSRSQRL
jgi:hypothetical protein